MVIDAVAKRLLVVGDITGNELTRIFRDFKGIRQPLSKNPQRFEALHPASVSRKSYP